MSHLHISPPLLYVSCEGVAALFLKGSQQVRRVARKAAAEMMQRGGKGDFYWGDDLAFDPVTEDRIVSDGDRVELGGVTLTAMLTPGHTKGCTSWWMRVRESGNDRVVLFECGLTASLYKLRNNPRYPNIVEDMRHTFEKLPAFHADVMLSPHAFYFDLEAKVAQLKLGAGNPFVRPDELQRHVAEMEKDFDEALHAQENPRLKLALSVLRH